MTFHDLDHDAMAVRGGSFELECESALPGGAAYALGLSMALGKRSSARSPTISER